ncbi:MAG: hypothetical protein ABJE66_38640 [Deltaproteobacteria bacterium]
MLSIKLCERLASDGMHRTSEPLLDSFEQQIASRGFHAGVVRANKSPRKSSSICCCAFPSARQHEAGIDAPNAPIVCFRMVRFHRD